MKQPTSERILVFLKQQGPKTSQQLAEQLSLTSMGIRKHLLLMREEGRVTDYSVAEKQGRPSQFWQLTDQGHAQFPDRHSELTVTMIETIRSVYGEEGLDKLITKREQETIQQYKTQLDPLTSLSKKVQTLVKLRTDEGYMAVAERDNNGDYWLYENHCPICSAANSCMNFCRSELDIFQAVFGNTVKIERTDHILAGARRCAYKINHKKSND